MPTPVTRGAARVSSIVRVYTKASWSGDWVFQPRIKVHTASKFLSSKIGECELLIYFGDVQLVGELESASFSDLDLEGHFVKITSEKALPTGPIQEGGFSLCEGETPESSQENVDWIGYVTENSVNPKSALHLRGIQKVKANTLEHLLDRVVIHSAIIQNDPGLPQQTIDWAPTFNQRDPQDKGEKDISPKDKKVLGNANDTQKVFSHTHVWDARHAIKYLLENFAPRTIPWDLDGQHEALDQWVDIWPQEGKSIKQFIDSIVSRKIGFTWYVNTDGETFADVRIQTMFKNDLNVGSITLPANDRQITYTIPTDIPGRFIFGQPSFRFTDTEKYSQVIVQGDRIKVVGTWSYADGTLTEGWTASMEASYRDPLPGNPNASVHQKDSARDSDIYKRVFVYHVVQRQGNQAWDGFLGDGANGFLENAIPITDEQGGVDFGASGGFYLLGCAFEGHLPFQEGFDYSKPPGSNQFDQNLVGVIPEYRKAMVLLEDPYDGKFMHAEKAHAKQLYLHPSHVQVLPKEFGIEVRCHPQHHNAGYPPDLSIPDADRRGDQFPGSQWNSQINYKKLVATLFLTIDQRPRILVPGDGSPLDLTLVVTVKTAQYWYALSNTVVDITPEGELLYINKDHSIPQALRQDLEPLQFVAGLVSEWFSVPRQAIKIIVHDVGYGLSISPELGMFLCDIAGTVLEVDVNSIVSGITFDYRVGLTTVETSFLSLDEQIDLGEVITGMQNLKVELDRVRR